MEHGRDLQFTGDTRHTVGALGARGCAGGATQEVLVGRQGFEKLLVWQKAKDLAVQVLLRTNEGQYVRDFGFRDQIRRAAVSVPSNIAEGDERDADRDAIRFFRIAKGSLAELRTPLQIAHEIGYLSPQESNELEETCISIGKMLGSLIKSRLASIV